MSTTVYDCSNVAERAAGLKHAARALAADGCVVLPTDTVYGIGADAFSARGVTGLLAAKGRTRAMPPPVLIAHAGVLDGLADEVSEDARALARAFWPGGLTLILHAQPSLGWDLGETRGTVALRVPDDDVARALLIETGPLAVSSANRTGRPAATTAQEAAAMLGESVELYLDDGPRGEPGTDPVASTIVDCTGEVPVVVRHGAIPLERLREVVPAVTAGDEPAPGAGPQPGSTGSHAADPAAHPAPGQEVPEPAAAPGADGFGTDGVGTDGTGAGGAGPAGGGPAQPVGTTVQAGGAAPLRTPGPAAAAEDQHLAATLVARSAGAPAPAVDQDRARRGPQAPAGPQPPLPVEEAARLVARGLGRD
ncbi:L-threonylcarbamoyladenylate synthase [Kocuria flava]|uniref:L-threonylcarbamoyladenylate synthase n=1 Tax=Kocuria flava TaxID=446860 RepID=UPI001FF31132|nr:L-threonylcarbamoyladenylate synthase [Kocuria flava]MCJ8505608.1 L-threonylcarbamoyladenylate synthase [Kocuria flava]